MQQTPLLDSFIVYKDVLLDRCRYVYCKFYRLQREVHLIFLLRSSGYRFARLLLLKTFYIYGRFIMKNE